MRFYRSDVDAWWSARSPGEKRFLHTIVSIARQLDEGQVLRLRFNGHSFTPTLGSDPNRELLPFGCEDIDQEPEQDDEEWWAELPSEPRRLVREVASLAKALQRDKDKSLEMRNSTEKLSVTLVMDLGDMGGGNPETN